MRNTIKLCCLAFTVLLVQIKVDALEFSNTNLELYRPVVVGETVKIDCATDQKNVSLDLLQLKKGADKPVVLKADGQRLLKVDQTFSVFVSGPESTGEYICDATVGSENVQKSLNVYIAGKVSGDIPKPELLVKPDSAVYEGIKLIFECKTKGTFAKLSWEKEGKQVADSLVTNKKPYFKDGTVIVESVLTINDVKLEDAGLYTCNSVSRFDAKKSANTYTIINVQGRVLKWDSDNPLLMNTVQTRLSSSVILSCTMSHPAKAVTFYRKAGSDGKLSKLVIDGKKYQLLNLQELVIYNVQNTDDGLYVCQVENDLLQDKEIKIFINQFAAQDPYAEVDPTFLDLDFNSSDNVTCTSYGNNVKVEWLRTVQINGQTELEKVPTENILAKFSLTPQGQFKRDWTLMFKKVTEADAGSYMCKVTVDTEPTFREVDVAVKPAQAPQIRKFSAQVTEENKRTSLNCRSNGAPSPKIQFFKDDVEIISGTKGYVIEGRKLKIEKPKFPDHDGLYTCYVTNMFGKATQKATLTVTVAPIINKSQRIVVVGSEDKLRITCNITRSNPVPRITWQYQPWSCPPSKGYDCDPISNSWKTADPTSYDIQPPTAVAMQSIFKVPKSSVQRFFVRCIAEHQYGKDTHQVIGIIDKRDPKSLLRASPGFQTNERESFKLECSGAAGFFLNLTWKKDDKAIQLAPSRVTIRKSGSILEDQQIILNVRNSTPDDSGFYTCIGKPARDEDSPVVAGTEVVINRIYPPVITTFESSVVNSNENAVIKCSIDSHPTAKVTWFKDGKTLVVESIGSIEECANREEGSYFELVDGVDGRGEGGKTMVQAIKPKHHKLVICKTQWKQNNGTYSCRAKNNLGFAREDSTVLVFAPPKMLYPQHDEYPSPEKSFSRNCTSEGNPLPYVWWEKEKDGKFVVVSKNSSTGVSYLTIKKFDASHYGKYRCVALNELRRMEDAMTLKKPVLIVGGYGSNNDVQQTASLVAALVAAVLIIIILIVLAIILYKRRRLYGGFYILSIPPSPDYFNKLDPTRPISDQMNKLPYFPEWEYPRNKIKLKNCVGAGAFGEVFIADAIGITTFDPRYKISAKHKPLLGKKRFSLSKSKNLSREDSVASSRSSRSTKSLVSKSGGDKNAVVAVKKLKDDASSTEYKDLISELKILIHIGQNKHIVNLLAACTKGIEKDSMVVLEFCPHGNLLSFIKSRRQMFKPIWSKQHLGMEKEFTMFDLCVAGYQIAKGLEFLAERKCVHRDVAARNVLVGENYVMKIADFGLARDVYKEESYIKMSGGLLPIKWMALESIMDRVFTHSSDVWSYGVLMWEVMTLGSAPYPGIPAKELPEFLSNGNRMDQPPRCPNEVFQLIMETWNVLPSHRPTFKDIVLRLARVVEAHCNPQDVPHYLEKEHVSGNSLSYEDQDYLRPVESETGGKFASSPSYASSLGRNDDVFRHRNDSSNQSERYVPDNRFKEIEVTERLLGDFGKKDMSDGISDKSIEHKSKMDEMVSEKDFKKHDKMNNNKNPYENTGEKNEKKKKEEAKLEMEMEKDIDEKEGLLDDDDRTPSVVEELSSFIDDQYEQMDRTDNYVNS